MQLVTLKKSIQSYKEIISDYDTIRDEFWWELQSNFQKKWNFNTPNFKKNYNEALESKISRRLWKADNFAPKDMMLNFLDLEPVFVKSMFVDLFNEEKKIENRIPRFVFLCEELLHVYKEKYPFSNKNNHDHELNHIVWMYLALAYPSKYAIVYFHKLEKILKKLGVVNAIKNYEYDRIDKFYKLIFKYLQEEEGIHDVLQSKFIYVEDYNEKSMLIVAHYIGIMSGKDFNTFV